MKQLGIVAAVLAALVLMTVGWGVSTYNGLVRSQESVKKSWSDVESAYQRRFDLIPNLVETVKGYAKHEADVLTAVTQARGQVGQIKLAPSTLTPDAVAEFQKAQAGLSGALTRLLAVAEAYPDLKANQNFRDLQVQLEGTENRINVARGRYNETAREYNTRAQSFPSSMIAGHYGFFPKPYFEADTGAKEAPKVKFQ